MHYIVYVNNVNNDPNLKSIFTEVNIISDFHASCVVNVLCLFYCLLHNKNKKKKVSPKNKSDLRDGQAPAILHPSKAKKQGETPLPSPNLEFFCLATHCQLAVT